LDDATHIAALTAKSAALRRNAVRALGDDARSQKLFFSSGVISDPDATTKLAALVRLTGFPTTKDIQKLVASIARNPANRADDWLNDAARMLARAHNAELFKEGPNLLPNPGFEVVGKDGLPEGWKRRDYGTRAGNAGAEWKLVKGEGQFHGGTQAMRCITRDDADTSFYADVALKTNTQYRLSAWIKVHAFRGKASLNDHIGRAETSKLTARESDWAEMEVVFNSGNRTKASINLLHVAKGDSYFDDVKLCEVLPPDDLAAKVTAGDAKRGEQIVFKHAAACILCHTIKGQGSTVGPGLDGIATRGTKEYIRESLLEPNKVLAKGFEQLGISPMPPMGDIFNPQELEDIQAYLQMLK
jgi:mono/diheme cytochrome c family protein